MYPFLGKSSVRLLRQRTHGFEFPTVPPIFERTTIISIFLSLFSRNLGSFLIASHSACSVGNTVHAEGL